MTDQEKCISLQVVESPDIGWNLPWDYDSFICFHFNSGSKQKIATCREQNAMSHAERGENAKDPSQGVTDKHRYWNVLKHENHNDQETSRYEVEEECHDLSIDVRREHKACHVCKGNNRRRVQKEQDPGSLILHLEHAHEQDDQEDRNVGHNYVECQI